MANDFSSLPVRVMQFGEGNFLRAFAGDMIDRANEAGVFSGSIAIVKPRGDAPLRQFTDQNCQYTVCIRGSDGQRDVAENRRITSVRQALNPNAEQKQYESICLSQDLRFIISNTTESGIRFDENDVQTPVPRTYPGRLTMLLYQRFVHFGADENKGVYVLPCELIDNNGDALRHCVEQYIELWSLPREFSRWLDRSCYFLNTLVDRIVSGFPKSNPEEFYHTIGYEDPLLTVCEPFHLWVIEDKGNICQEFPLDKADSGVLFVPDVTPYKLRKVRLLNGAHTSLAAISLLSGVQYVSGTMSSALLCPFLEDLFREEIIPPFTQLPREDLDAFAESVKQRFCNPFLHHRWADISLNSFSKFVARLMPTVRDSTSVPQRIALAFAALVELYCTTETKDDPQILAFFRDNSNLHPRQLIRQILSSDVFGLEMSREFENAACLWLEHIRSQGIEECVRSFSSLIHIHETDNVAVCKESFPEGKLVCADRPFLLQQSIPMGHKVALKPIKKGETIFKYGFSIGRATEDVLPGSHIHSHNMKSCLTGQEVFSYHPTVFPTPAKNQKTFQGYLRENGKVGIRNEIWIIPTVGCINATAESLAKAANEHLPSGIDCVVALTHPYGCSQLGEDHETTKRILAALASHPNAGGVLLLGLGCENNQLSDLLELVDHPNLRSLVCQEVSDELAEGSRLLDELMRIAAKARRQDFSADRLIVGLKCGGSDAFSGITANAITGAFSDKLCALGGSAVMGEVPEMFGAEESLLTRCRTEAVFREACRMIDSFKKYYLDRGLPVCENPSPGNRAGGITTLEEKSLGCTQKCGRAPITDVLEYGGVCRLPGVTLLNTPGNDLVASTALAASGCHLILFTTGRGTPYGTCVPTLKLSSNTPLAQQKPGWIDFDGGRLLCQSTLDALAEELLDTVLQTASGHPARNEENGFRQIAIFKNGVTL